MMIKLGSVPVDFNSLQSDTQRARKLWSEKYPLTVCRIARSLLMIRIKSIHPVSWFMSSIPMGHQAWFRSHQLPIDGRNSPSEVTRTATQSPGRNGGRAALAFELQLAFRTAIERADHRLKPQNFLQQRQPSRLVGLKESASQRHPRLRRRVRVSNAYSGLTRG